jgi:hypothetical protein
LDLDHKTSNFLDAVQQPVQSGRSGHCERHEFLDCTEPRLRGPSPD